MLYAYVRAQEVEFAGTDGRILTPTSCSAMERWHLCLGLYSMLLYFVVYEAGYVCKLTNLKCVVLDNTTVDIKYCRIKAVSRNDNYLAIYVNIKQPVKKLTVRVTLLRRENGWKPFLYNITFDGCKLLKNPKANPIAGYFYGILEVYSNLNHSCPITHDVVIEKLRLVEEIIRLPFPPGEYGLDTLFSLNNKQALAVTGACKLLDL